MARLPKHEIAEITGINMTPLIDVVMQLLLFFMLTSSMIKPNRIELELPESTSGVRAAEVDSITVDYRLESGAPRISLNGETCVVSACLQTSCRVWETWISYLRASCASETCD